jgi:hypothetical protein
LGEIKYHELTAKGQWRALTIEEGGVVTVHETPKEKCH